MTENGGTNPVFGTGGKTVMGDLGNGDRFSRKFGGPLGWLFPTWSNKPGKPPPSKVIAKAQAEHERHLNSPKMLERQRRIEELDEKMAHESRLMDDKTLPETKRVEAAKRYVQFDSERTEAQIDWTQHLVPGGRIARIGASNGLMIGGSFSAALAGVAAGADLGSPLLALVGGAGGFYAVHRSFKHLADHAATRGAGIGVDPARSP
jgi:hypothetical protein